jgi:hypothetical protein
MRLEPVFQALLIAFAALAVSSVSILAVRVVVGRRTVLLLVPENAREEAPPVIPLSRGGATIGRDQGCTIQILDPYVSSMHTAIYFRRGEYYVRDLGSKNGTRVNGVRIRETRLSPGDVLEVGSRRFRVMMA